MRVRSAPFRPGASPINITRASGEPFKELSTALRPHIAGHAVQLAASSTNSLNFLLTTNDFDLTRLDIVIAVAIRPTVWADEFDADRVFPAQPTR